MIFARESGTNSAPGWVNVIHAAREWGCTPWEIAGGHRVKWFYRWKAMREVLQGANG